MTDTAEVLRNTERTLEENAIDLKESLNAFLISPNEHNESHLTACLTLHRRLAKDAALFRRVLDLEEK